MCISYAIIETTFVIGTYVIALRLVYKNLHRKFVAMCIAMCKCMYMCLSLPSRILKTIYM